jgi:hypothetical protein
MGLVAQFAGSVMILAAYAASQLGWISMRSWSYLLLNLVGSGILAADVWIGRQWGFLFLELAWVGISAWGMARRGTVRSQDS